MMTVCGYHFVTGEYSGRNLFRDVGLGCYGAQMIPKSYPGKDLVIGLSLWRQIILSLLDIELNPIAFGQLEEVKNHTI